VSVYFIEAVGVDLVKIGHARSVAVRLRVLRPASPVALRLMRETDGGPQEARGLHERFAEHRVHDEWFHLPPLREFIESVPEDYFQKRRESALGEAVAVFEGWLREHDVTPYRFALDNGIDPSVIRKNLLHHRGVSLETALKIERGTAGEVPAKLFSAKKEENDVT
jgi:hypothetical protein